MRGVRRNLLPPATARRVRAVAGIIILKSYPRTSPLRGSYGATVSRRYRSSTRVSHGFLTPTHFVDSPYIVLRQHRWRKRLALRGVEVTFCSSARRDRGAKMHQLANGIEEVIISSSARRDRGGPRSGEGLNIYHGGEGVKTSHAR